MGGMFETPCRRCRAAAVDFLSLSIVIFLIAGGSAGSGAQQSHEANAAKLKLVDPLMGTGPDGHTFPGRDGAVRDGAAVAGYADQAVQAELQVGIGLSVRRHDDPRLFAHAFLGERALRFGRCAGAADCRARCGWSPARDDKPGSGYRSRFSHDKEHAEPGYYAVDLLDYGIHAELTATPRVGVHRYTYPAGKPASVLVDLRSSIYNYPGKVLWSRMRIRDDGTVTGMRETRGWAPGRQAVLCDALFAAGGDAQPVRSRTDAGGVQGIQDAGDNS